MSYKELESAVQFADNNLAYGIKSTAIGWKKTNNEYIRGEKSVVFGVEHKKDISELSENEIIPSSITIDGITYKTDVVEHIPIYLDDCYNFPAEESAQPLTDNTVLNMRWNFTSGNHLTSNYPAAIGRDYTDAASGLMGGTQVIKFPDSYAGGVNNFGQARAAYLLGTMGFIAVDNEDGRIVGVTNTHVACDRKFRNSDRFRTAGAANGVTYFGELDDPYSLVHPRPRNLGLSDSTRTYTDDNGNYILSEPPGTFPPQLIIRTWDFQNFNRQAVQQYPPLASDSTFIQTAVVHEDAAYSYVLNSGAYMLKRYSPFVRSQVTTANRVDACVFDIDDKFLEDYSYKLREPDGDMNMVGEYLEFATTTELDNMLTNPPNAIYSVGRTTGPKGFFANGRENSALTSCILECVATNAASQINFREREQAAVSAFTNLIQLQFTDGSANPSDGGDSGSAYIADLTGNGDFKVIGLHFAGGTNFAGEGIALGCRIDEVASRMNISAWTGATSVDTSRPTKTVVTRPYTQDDPDQETITIGGHTYYNVGLAHAHRVITQYGHSITTQDDDTIEYYE